MIRIENLAFSYGKVPVLKNITMDLEPGRVYGLLGENGVGKTTLLTLLCGLKKVSQGQIVTDGHLPYDREPSFLENQYFLSDEPYAANMKASEYARINGAFWRNFSMQKFIEIMKLFENDPEKNMSKMSAGQLKKTFISFALACNVRYLFMDEPTNGLDIPSKAQFRSAITRYTAEDSTVVISTHQVRDLENIIDPIVILDCQDILLNASIAEIAEKLYFDYGTEYRPESLYSEQIPGSFVQVLPNVTGEESKVNVEALFNVVRAHKDFIKSMFTK